MKKKTTISVTIATVNAPSSLLKSLKGYFNQTLKPLEIIVVCGSQGFTKIANFLKNNKNAYLIRLIRFDGDKNDARNIGFSKSSGDFIIYADEDMIPRENLIKECSKVADNFDAIIIPEEGSNKKNFLSKIHRLEKEILRDDNNTLTPRLFKRLLFKNNEMPFDKKFGVLDEWGFYSKLKTKNPKIGTVMSFFTVEENMSLFERFKKNYAKGLWIRNLIKENKEEGFRRASLIKRVIQFYSKSHYFTKTPIIFTSLLFIKVLDFFAF